MKKAIATLMTLFMLGCNAQHEKIPVDDEDPGSSSVRCPSLPSNLGITIKGEQGVDFLSCLATSDETGKALFDIYVGNFPDVPDGLRYAGATSTAHGNLAWFLVPGRSKPWEAKQWITFIPTGDESMSIMMVSFYAKREDLKGIADIVAQIEK
jgi:hypothetical protein